ncbi:MAG: hypothetical protein CME70_14290 [Halobacteriovorax sp.]|nr:hypothetical protein [Halobacteriovorax sp.]|tara:strand:+ start:281339 stop:281998 length:660 start_codon:yes stop_codon:yes gene_type:complete
MKVTCTILLSILFLASCGVSSRGPATSSQIGQALVAGGEFSDDEKNTAIRICYALRSKNTNFRANFLDQDFRFLITERDCDGEEANSTITAQLKGQSSNDQMIYSGLDSSKHFANVITDQDGPMSGLCSSLLQGGNPQRSILSGNDLVSFSFYATSQDFMIRRVANKVGEGFIINLEERYTILTDPTSSGLKIGKVSLATKDETCSNGAVATISQQALD